jgi:hypothetical protein
MRKKFILILFTFGVVFIPWVFQLQAQINTDDIINEPFFTKGDSNKVYCPGTKLKEFQISTDLINWLSARIRVDSSCVFGPLTDGMKYYYRVRFTSDSSYSTTTAFSMQDTTSPQIDMISIGTLANPENQWLNKSTFNISFFVSDSTIDSNGVKNRGAGIDTVWCYWRICGENWLHKPQKTWDFNDDLTGKPGRSEVDSSFTFIDSLNDACYEFFFQAKDAAYKPESPGLNEDSWVVDGNKSFAPGPAMASIRIDTQKPFSNILCDSLPEYINAATDSIHIHYVANDTLNGRTFHSGIDTVWLYYITPEGETIKYSFQTNFNDKSAVDSSFTISGTVIDLDGKYVFYTIAKDFSGLKQDIPTSPTCSTFVDTQAPALDSIKLKDITPSIMVPDTAEPGWTNELEINVCFYGLRDSTKNNFISGIDKIFIYGGGDSTTHKYNPDEECYPFTLSAGDDEKKVLCTVIDSAGNKTTIADTIILDSQPPELLVVNIPLEKTTLRNILIDINQAADGGRKDRLSRVRLSEDSTFFFDQNLGEYRDPTTKDTTYQDTVWFELSQNNGSKKVYGQVRDKAGIWSNLEPIPMDSIELEKVVVLKEVLISDLNDTSNICYQPDSNWTNQNKINVAIKKEGTCLRILISEDSTFIDPKTYTCTDNSDTIELMYTFKSSAQEKKCLWIKLLGPNETDTSNTLSACINYDTSSPPKPESFFVYSVFNTLTGSDTSFSYTNSSEVRIFVQTQLDSLSKMEICEFVQPSCVCYDSLNEIYDVSRGAFGITYNVAKFDEDGSVYLSCSLIDSAANRSSRVFSNTITLDTLPPIIEKFELSDPSSSESDYCNDDSVAVTVELHDNNMLYLLELYQLDSNLNPVNIKQWQLTGTSKDTTVIYPYDENFIENEDLTVHCNVYDAAGDSSTTSDSIKMVFPLEILISLYDINDPDDDIFSHSDTVGLRIIRKQGLIDSICYWQYPDSQNGNFIPWQQGRDTLDTTYTFGLNNMTKEVILCCKATNNLGDTTIVCDTIIVDLQDPTINKQNPSLICPSSGDSLWANDRDIEIYFQACDNLPGELLKIIIAESEDLLDNQKEHQIESSPDDCVSKKLAYKLSSQQGIKEIFISVIDKAERSSSIFSAGEITLNEEDKISNYPNPFTPSDNTGTNLFFILKEDSDVKIIIYDLFGNLVTKWNIQGRKGINDVDQNPTNEKLTWSGRNDKGDRVATGGYICVIKADNETLKRKIAVIN